PKPFSPRELLARIRATVRRVRGQAGPAQQTVQVGGLILDPQKMTVTLDGTPIDVTAYEFSILRALAQRPGRVLSREQLLDLAKGSAELSFDRSIDVHVSRLRAKLGDDSRNPKILKTVRGAGYLTRFDASGHMLHSNVDPPLDAPSEHEKRVLRSEKWSLDIGRIVVRSDDGSMIGVYSPDRGGTPWSYIIPLGAIILVLVGV